MMNKFLVLLALMTILAAPGVALSDCTDLALADSSYVQGAHTVIFYRGRRPLARLEVPYCQLYPDSEIRLTKTYTCDTDSIIVDGQQCMIGTVYTASTTPSF